MRSFTPRSIKALPAALALLILLAGCGGQSTPGPPQIDDQLFTPNFVRSVPLYHWDHLPVKISFVLPGDWAQRFAGRESLHVVAANEWNQPGLQPFVSVISAGQPDVVVTFVPQSALGGNAEGVTTYNHAGDGTMVQPCTIRVALDTSQGDLMSADDVQSVIAHEVGHSLGIGGHSPNRFDLMYSTHTFGQLQVVTPDDLNTIMSAYPHYFGRAMPLDRSIPQFTGIRTDTIE